MTSCFFGNVTFINLFFRFFLLGGGGGGGGGAGVGRAPLGREEICSKRSRLCTLGVDPSFEVRKTVLADPLPPMVFSPTLLFKYFNMHAL